LATEQFTRWQVPQEPGQPVHVTGLLEGFTHARHLFGRERQAALGLQEVGHGDGSARRGRRTRRRTLAESFHTTAGRQADAAGGTDADDVPRRHVRHAMAGARRRRWRAAPDNRLVKRARHRLLRLNC